MKRKHPRKPIEHHRPQTRAGYWFVKWGSAVRISSNKHATARGAARDCYGTVARNMLCKMISTRKQDVQSDRFRKRVMDDPEGWIPPAAVD